MINSSSLLGEECRQGRQLSKAGCREEQDAQSPWLCSYCAAPWTMQHLWITEASKCSKNLQIWDACCHHRELGVQEAALGCWCEEKHHCEAFVEFSHTLACHWHQPSSRFGGLLREKGPIVSHLDKNSLQGLACQPSTGGGTDSTLVLFFSHLNPTLILAVVLSVQISSAASTWEMKLIVLIQLHLLQAGLSLQGLESHPITAQHHDIADSALHKALWGCWWYRALWAQRCAHSFSLLRYQHTKRQQIEFTLLIAFI